MKSKAGKRGVKNIKATKVSTSLRAWRIISYALLLFYV